MLSLSDSLPEAGPVPLLLHSRRRALPSAPLAFAATRTFAASLLSLPLSGTANVDGDLPLFSDVLGDSSEQPPLASRML